MQFNALEVAVAIVGAVCAIAGAVMSLLLLGVGLWGMFSGFATKKDTDIWRAEIRGSLAAVINAVDKINGRITALETWRQVLERANYVGPERRRDS